MKNIIIFDLDGTLADGEHRLHHIKNEPKDWKTYFSLCRGDDLIPHVAALFYLLRKNPAYEIWIVTGRSNVAEAETREWLYDHYLHPDKLIMRQANDHTDDDVLKAMWVVSGTIPKEKVMMVFEDRTRVVKAWRQLGIPCLQVSEGDF